MIKQYNRETRLKSTKDEPAENQLVARGKAVMAACRPKVEFARNCGVHINPFMIRRGHRSVDNKGNGLIDLPRRENIVIRIKQALDEMDRINDTVNEVIRKR